MRFALSAAWPRQAELQGYAAELRQMGHTVTSSWLDAATNVDDGVTLRASPEAKATIIARDLADIRDCEVFIAFSEPPSSPWTRGTRHFEMGFALAAQKGLILVGPREEQLGHWLAGLQHFEMWQECAAFLRRFTKQGY